MVEEFIGGSIETVGETNSLSEASEEQMVRVRENMKMAQQMGSQIRDDQKKNTHVAQFLTYLFGAVTDDEIWTIAVELFSKPDQNNLGMTLAIYEMITLFLPFYAGRADEAGMSNSFPAINYELTLTWENYVNYVKLLYTAYPLYQQLDKDTLSDLMTAILLFHRAVILEEGKTPNDLSAQIRSALN